MRRFSRIQFIHASPDAPGVDIFVGFRRFARNLQYPDNTRYRYFWAGTRRVTVALRRSGDVDYDKRCIHVAYGTLISYPGDDPFRLRLVDEQQTVDIDFPNETTYYCDELVETLTERLGAEVWIDSPPDN